MVKKDQLFSEIARNLNLYGQALCENMGLVFLSYNLKF